MSVLARKECRHHPGYLCPEQDAPHAADKLYKLPKRKQRKSPDFRVAQMLSIIMDEPGDDAENPDAIRLSQASALLSAWSSAQGFVIGMLREVIRIKMGYCVRCPTLPCPICGWDENSRLPV